MAGNTSNKKLITSCLFHYYLAIGPYIPKSQIYAMFIVFCEPSIFAAVVRDFIIVAVRLS